jgi:integrase
MASVDKLADGRWRARWRTPEGSSRSKTFARKVDADKHLTSVEHSKYSGAYIDQAAGKVTLEDYSKEWTASRVHRASTLERADVYLRVHINPFLGKRPLGSIRHSEVQAWVRGRSEVLSARTVDNVFRVVSGIFRSAIRDRIVALNPCDGITLPRPPHVEIVPPTVDEVQALLAALPARYRVLGILAAGAGLRQGEALGLTVDRVDFLRKTLRVDRQLYTPAKGEPDFVAPKSASSVRTIPIATSVVEALSAHLAAFAPGPGGLITTYEDGRPIRRNRFGAMWRQSTARAGLAEPHRFHDLRHHHASLLIAAGCSVKVVQRALGHANARETLDVYSHLWPDSDDLTRSAVDAALSRVIGVSRPNAVNA